MDDYVKAHLGHACASPTVMAMSTQALISHDEPLAALVRRWRSEGIELLPPEPESAVRVVFERLGTVATPDVIALYGALGGMAEMDSEYWRLWSLEEVAAENTRRLEEGVQFSDYMINCWTYRLKPVDAAASAVRVDVGDRDGPASVASTLNEFLAEYAVDATQLLYRGLPQAEPAPRGPVDQPAWFWILLSTLLLCLCLSLRWAVNQLPA